MKMWNLFKIFVAIGFILLNNHHVIEGSPVVSINRIPTRHNRIANAQHIPRIKSNSFQMSREPWLHPKEGVLASENTKVLFLLKDKNATLRCHEMNNAIGHIVKHSEYLAPARIFNNVHRDRRTQFSTRRRYREKKKLRGRPSIVYPELAIAVSYEYFKKFNFDYWTILPYLLSFWNAVDMRYRNLENPKYRFHISKIIFESEPGNFEFLEENGSPDFLTNECINNARTFWYEQDNLIPVDSYDMILVMTSAIICVHYNKENNQCFPHIFGQAWSSGACSINHAAKKIEKVAIINDNGAFEGVTTAAHEIGHLLGAHDDGISFYNNTSKEWGPSQCSLWEGYIMSGNKIASRNSFEWSECSVRKFEKFINSDAAKCLYNKPANIGRPVPRYLAGKLMSADEQCEKIGAIESCEDEVSNCVMLKCRFKDKGCTNTTAPAVEGTYCGSNTIAHICIHGECVPEYSLV